MVDKIGEIIYVGKAKNLKKRVSSYFHRQLDTKTQQMVRQIHSVQVTVTRNEREALLLESNLIKEYKPKYNVIFRDDKTYPYLYLSTAETYPQLMFYRGDKSAKGKYYGPYPSAGLAREALNFLQTLFKLRQCDNTFFKNRTRPCLQYQIKRCTAPCVGYVDPETYAVQVARTRAFLEGKSQEVLDDLIEDMAKESKNLNYERAAQLRDNVRLLRKVQENQIIEKGSRINLDVLSVVASSLGAAIHLLIVREGRILGSRTYFPNVEGILQIETPEDETKEESEIEEKSGVTETTERRKKSKVKETPESELLTSFILQHYMRGTNSIPEEIVLSASIPEEKDIEALLEKETNHKVQLNSNPKGVRNQWLQMAMESAYEALKRRSSKKSSYEARFAALQEALQLEMLPARIECFDVSHTFGTSTVASCVVFGTSGPTTNAYRRFNIKTAEPGDDYAALKEALTRRYTRLKEENGTLPDILMIDGGKGQLSQAEQVMRELQVAGVTLLAVAKGPSRKAGLETLYLSSRGSPITISNDSPALHLIQRIRDEAHRFAISLHRKQRGKKTIRSSLEDIPGIGKAKRMAILQHFGGLQEVLQASVDELAKVPGISYELAERIYQTLHGE